VNWRGLLGRSDQRSAAGGARYAAEAWLQQTLRAGDRPAPPCPATAPSTAGLQTPRGGLHRSGRHPLGAADSAPRGSRRRPRQPGFSSYVAALLMLIDRISHLTTLQTSFQQGQPRWRRYGRIEAEAVGNSPDPIRCQGAGPRVGVGACGLEGVWFRLRPTNRGGFCAPSSSQAPLASSSLGGAVGSRQRDLFSLLLAFNTAQRRSGAARTARNLAGPARARSEAVPTPWCPAELRGSRNGWQRGDPASDVQPAASRCAKAARANAAGPSSNACRGG